MKKTVIAILAVILCLCALCAVAVSVSADEPEKTVYPHGDFTKDGEIDMQDVVYYMGWVNFPYLTDLYTIDYTGDKDFNHDNTIDMQDVVYYMGWVNFPYLGIYDIDWEHSEVIDAAVAPTCTETGLTEGKHCSICNKILVAQDVIPASHTIIIDEAVAPTCTETGLTEGKHCSVCNEILVVQEIVPANGHTYCNDVCSVCGAKKPSEGLEFVSNGDGTCYVSDVGVCTDSNIVIPSLSPDVDIVTGIGDNAFYNWTTLTSVTIPNTVMSIGSHAFSGCSSLLLVIHTQNSQLLTIGDYAFQNCNRLKQMPIPDSVTSIGEGAFENCNKLQYNDYDNAKYLGNENNPYVALIEADNLSITSCAIHSKTKIIVGYAFSGCNSLISIEIPNSVTSIGEYVFYGCESIEYIDYNGTSEELENVEKGSCWNLREKEGQYFEIFVHCTDLHNIVIDPIKLATCTETGLTEGKHCWICNKVLVAQQTVDALGHTSGDSTEENRVEPTCTIEGSYDEVVYCNVCKIEISREKKTIKETGHTPGETVTENYIAATCTDAGSYDSTIYCTVCNVEISRENNSIDALGHRPGDSIEENRIDPTCTVAGSYDDVIYCIVCQMEISRESKTIKETGHTPGETVTENYIAATCTETGSYDIAIYCTVCNFEISRENNSIDALGHRPGVSIEENRIDPTCTVAGSYDDVIYCIVCQIEISRESKTIKAMGHSVGNDNICDVCGHMIVSDYEEYMQELAAYNARVAAYDAYQRELAYYNEHNADWVAYDEQLAAYNAYIKYIADLEDYNNAMSTYDSRLEAYEAYNNYMTNLQKCEAALTVIEAVINGGVYETLIGETVDIVLAHKDDIAGYTTISRTAIQQAGDATEALRSILSGYPNQGGLRQRFEYYKSNYSLISSNFSTLYSCLYRFYDENAVRIILKQEGKEVRYCEFLCDLYCISCCLDDSRAVNRGWRISYSDGIITYSAYYGLKDTNTADPSRYVFPDDVPFAEYPEIPVMPEQVDEALEPIAPGGTHPVPPTQVAHPGKPPLLLS